MIRNSLLYYIKTRAQCFVASALNLEKTKQKTLRFLSSILPMETNFHFKGYCRFFTYVNENNLFSRQSYRALIDLLDNYDMFQGRDEVTTSTETDEQNAFLNYFMSSNIGSKLYSFFSEKGWSAKLVTIQLF